MKKLRTLLERRRRAEVACHDVADQLAVAAFEACERDGASRRGVAAALGVGTSTVQGWVTRGRQVLEGG